jgi:hypothetical protein
MNIEARLESIDTSLKTLVTILQSAGAITAVAGAPKAAAPAATEKKTRTKKTDDAVPATAAKADLVDGDPEGTRYWVSDETQTVYAQKPGDIDPTDQSFKIESSAQYLAKKAEFAKNAAAVAEAQKPAATAPTATPQPDTASAGAVEWDTVFREIKALSTAPTGGRDAVLGVLKHFGCEGKTVPALKDLNRNADILAHVQGLMAPAGDDLGL